MNVHDNYNGYRCLDDACDGTVKLGYLGLIYECSKCGNAYWFREMAEHSENAKKKPPGRSETIAKAQKLGKATRPKTTTKKSVKRNVKKTE